jgi:hypothetical protein
MPRRNRNAARVSADADQLTAALAVPATGLVICDGKFPCVGCRKRGHWNGRYCTICLGALVLSARRTVLGR